MMTQFILTLNIEDLKDLGFHCKILSCSHSQPGYGRIPLSCKNAFFIKNWARLLNKRYI
jgi:hypothetical protein